MNRRGFLGALTAAVTGAVLDPEKLLWRPGAKMIFIPPARVGNCFITPEQLIRETLITLQNNLMLARAINGGYGEFFQRRPLRIGDTLNVRMPRAFMGLAR